MSKPIISNPPVGARIVGITPGSIAAEISLQPGDLLLSINGAPLTDYIAYRFATADENLTLEIARGEERAEIEIEKDADEDLGLIFAEDVFDGVRRCRNRCVFCFEDQLPATARDSLRLRDDDFRLSFLHGNFITMTNLTEEDITRIVRDRLTPLYVSIHATDTAVRRHLLRNRRAPDICRQLRRLGMGGIETHGQIVLCPGWNDGAVLESTLEELAELYPYVRTVGVVPVGLSAFRPADTEVRPLTAADALAALEIIERRQVAQRKRLGTRQVFAADEFYLLAGRPLPATYAYEGFPQRENGIGLARLFLDEVEAIVRAGGLEQSLASGTKVTLVTGLLAAPLLEEFTERLRVAGAEIEVLAVKNLFFGGNVTVAGLLTGQDLLAAFADRDPGNAVLLPAAMLNADGIFLDDLTPAAVEKALGVPLYFCKGPRDVLALLAVRAQDSGFRVQDEDSGSRGLRVQR